MATLAALEQTWIALNLGQPPDDLYVNAARFRLGHYPSMDEKITILKTAIQTYTRFMKELINEKLASVIEEAMNKTEITKIIQPQLIS